MDATRTALLVDDEPDSLTTHRARLVGEGYTVFVAENHADALSRAKQSLPKVIFVHLVAAATGNLPLIQALRSDDSCRHIPVIVIKDQANAGAPRSKLHVVPHDSW
jgi:two-component system alkaline phosphatase synthesis response regulator PhoP